MLLVVLGVYLIGRAAVEPFTTDPRDPSTYAADWGGPHYAGVLAVHMGGGLLAAVALVRWHRRRPRRRARAGAAPRL